MNSLLSAPSTWRDRGDCECPSAIDSSVPLFPTESSIEIQYYAEELRRRDARGYWIQQKYLTFGAPGGGHLTSVDGPYNNASLVNPNPDPNLDDDT